MYSKLVTERNLDRAEDYLRRTYNLGRDWSLQYPRRGELAEMREHFSKLLDAKGVPKRPMTREEDLWILEQHTLCKNDFLYYAKNYVKIVDWESKVSYFKPNLGQKIMLGQMASAEEKGHAQMWQILKARQIGFTTLWQALISHRIFLFRNVKGMTGSAAEEKSKAMVGKMAFIWDQMDWWFRPAKTRDEQGKLMEFGDLNSDLRVAWGNQKTGIGRGSTPTVVHLSELASFENAEELVDASLIRTQHENPFTLMGFESTAEGIGNWWHRTWNVNMEFSSRGMARMNPVFFPWYVATDIYPTKSAMDRRPLPADWDPPEYILNHAAAARVYVQETPMLKAAMGDSWEMSREQMWFYFIEYEEARYKKEVPLFLQEMSSTPDESFQSSNPTVFSPETLAEVRIGAQLARPVDAYALTGREIPLVYSPGTGRGRPIPLVCKDGGGRHIETFGLESLGIDRWPDMDSGERVYIWEWPQPGEEYGLGVDVAEGVDQDSSVIQVVKKGTPEHPDEQVAEWASSKVQQPDLWAFVFALAHLYTTMTPQGQIRWPRVVVEVNLAGGDLVQTEMIKRGWGHFHQMVDLTKDGGSGLHDSRDLRKVGWLTTTKSRPKLISLARKMIRDKQLVVRSPWLAGELATLAYNLDKQRIEAAEGNHDDRFMAMGILMTSWYDPDVYGTAPMAWRETRARENELANMPVYTGGMAIGKASNRWRDPGPQPKTDTRSMKI